MLSYRSVSPIEFVGIMKGTIPVCDEFGDYNIHGQAVVKKNGKVGVVNKVPRLIVPIENDDVEILDNGTIVVCKGGEYFLHNECGAPIFHPTFTSKSKAIEYAERS